MQPISRDVVAPGHPRPYYPELDGVRALAALMIVVFHLAQMGVPIPGPVALGQTGVDLFFVLSGFLITSILLKCRERDWHEVRTFYIRRSLRIFPLYFGYLAVASALGIAFSRWSWVYLQNVAFALGRPMGAIGHFWSLAVEEQFYLVWPFLVLFLPRRLLQPALWMMIAAAVLCRLALVHTGVDVFYLTPTRLDGLAAGGLLAIYLYRSQLHAYRRWLAFAGGVSIVLLLVEAASLGGQRAAVVQVTRYALLGCAYAAVVGLLITSRPSAATRWLASRPMKYLGRVSYGIYVFHPQALHFAFEHLAVRPVLFRVAAGLLLTAVLTLTSWYAWERPFLKLKDRWTPENAPKPVAISTPT